MIQDTLFGVPISFFNMKGEYDTIDRIMNELRTKIKLNDGSDNGTLIEDTAIIASEIAEETGGDIVASITPLGRILFTKVAHS